jgi:hypothetical protein
MGMWPDRDTPKISVRPKCVYIAGSGRNGSTLLGLHLDRFRQMFFAGELTHIWQRGYLNNELCGCGVPFSQCDFWQEVTGQAFGRLTSAEAAHLKALRDKISAFIRLPRLFIGCAPEVSPSAAEYLAAYEQLVQSIARVAGVETIIDSSKYPTDLSLLVRSKSISLQTIHLIRNCNAVVYSWKRKKRRREIHWKEQFMPQYGSLQTAFAWRVFNSAIPRVCSRRWIGYPGNGQMPQLILLRYEDLVEDPNGTLYRLATWLGTSDDPWRYPTNSQNHTVSGNPCRFEFDPSQVQLDDEWSRHLSCRDRLTVRLICGRMQRSLGY